MNANLLNIGDIHVPDVIVHDPEELARARTRAAVWLTLIFWGVSFGLATLTIYLDGKPQWLAMSLMRIPPALLGLGFCYLIHLLLRSKRLTTTKSRLIALALVAPVLAEIFAWANYFAVAAVDPSASLEGLNWSAAIRTVLFWTWFFLAWAGLYLALMYGFDVNEEQRRSAELRERAHVAQLRALHSQINPHFLFNSLNSVSALILDKNSEKAEEMVVRLARFLRLGLAADPTRKIPLDLEIELQRSYLEIEQARYPDLSVEVSLPAAVKGALVPSLILQPIVENAVKYGVAAAPPNATIAIEARAEDGKLVLEVIDSGKGTGSQNGGSGIGLANVRQRLALLYGEESSSLSASRGDDGQFRVEVTLPLELP
ncbi:MAG TPA: histidine kinase [Sphingomicrobium sp.]|nr:histidine kinase [Sphingomicrobium sp.]